MKKGMKNLYKHIDNLKNIFGQNVIVAINKFNTDTGVELNYLKEELSKRNIKVSIVESWAKGGEGGIELAKAVLNKRAGLELGGVRAPLLNLQDGDEAVVDKTVELINKALAI